MTFWRWLLNGSEEMVMSKEWLANRDRLRHYTGYTMRQRHQGRVVADVDEMRRRAFWEAVAAKREQRAVIRQFGRGRA